MNEQVWYLTYSQGIGLCSRDVTVTNQAYLASAITVYLGLQVHNMCIEFTNDDHALVWNYNKTIVLATLTQSNLT